MSEKRFWNQTHTFVQSFGNVSEIDIIDATKNLLHNYSRRSYNVTLHFWNGIKTFSAQSETSLRRIWNVNDFPVSFMSNQLCTFQRRFENSAQTFEFGVRNVTQRIQTRLRFYEVFSDLGHFYVSETFLLRFYIFRETFLGT